MSFLEKWDVSLFFVKNKAALRKDFTIQYGNRFYQILDAVRTDKVAVEERLNGKIHIYHRDKELRYKLIDKRPQKAKPMHKPRKRYIPPSTHPYKLLFKKLKRKCA